MKTKIAFLGLILLYTLGSTAQNRENNWTEFGLKGKVKSVREAEYIYGKRDNSLSKPEQKDSFFVLFDSQGNRTFLWHYNADGTVKSRSQNHFNDSGYLVFSEWSNTQEGVLWSLRCRYDKTGNKIEQKEYMKKRFMEKSLFVYNSLGHLVSEHKYARRGKLIFRSEYITDSKGNLTEEKRYDPKGALEWMYTWHHDSTGLLLETAWYGPDKKAYGRDTYVFDSLSNLIERNNYNSDGTVYEKYTYSYSYDIHNNWTRKTEAKNGITVKYHLRELEYY